MKLFLNSIVILSLFCWPLYAEETYKNYTVKVAGIKIGELNWTIKLNKDEYLNKIYLRSRGLLTSIYSFSGEYFSEGLVYENKLVPKKYTHLWTTKKKQKKMNLVFDERKLKTLEQDPAENEEIRLNIFEVQHTNDPLTSFLKIMMGEKKALVVDGRRLYTMTSKMSENKEKSTIEISNYYNLWADHKRNKFEKIIFEKKPKAFLPYKMFIYFDGKIFRIEEN